MDKILDKFDLCDIDIFKQVLKKGQIKGSKFSTFADDEYRKEAKEEGIVT